MKADFTIRNSASIYLGPAEELLPELLTGRRVVLVTDTEIQRLYPALCSRYPHLAIGRGEEHKSLATVEQIHRALIDLGADRKSFLLAVGGGIVTDTAGFAASTYMRGIDFGFVSTTLLGQVDASVGGKNGVNVGGYKNMAGTFTQPQFVVCDPAMLATLPDREFRAGLAEVVKAAVIGDADLFVHLEQRSFEELRRDTRLLGEVVRAAVAVKAAIVERDEREAGDRRLLNLGHTPAHAIEKCSSAMNHGEAVAVGLNLVAEVAVRLGFLTPTEQQRIATLLTRLGFALQPPVPLEHLLEAIGKDKKSEGEHLHLVLPEAIGQCRVLTLPKTEIKELFL